LTFLLIRDSFKRHIGCWGKGVPPTSPDNVSQLLARWNAGDVSARDALVPFVYDELRRIARRCLAGQGRDHTLQPTALVHEAYLRLARRDSANYRDRMHFFALAAQIMRQILIDHARKSASVKRGANAVTLSLDDALDHSEDGQKKTCLDLMALDNAMNQLAKLDARQCKIVELRFFGGLSIEEAAEIVEISPATAKREWATARVWLHRTMSESAAL
jgi:RNA polymerase sigma factor (TIGR02999 family)